MELRDYQVANAQKICNLLAKLKFAYLMAEVRTGKTLTALHAADLAGFKKVLFVTKKKAISSIESDYKKLAPGFLLHIVNYESVHNPINYLKLASEHLLDPITFNPIIDQDYDLLICDEIHRLGSFPKPGLAARNIKAKFGHLPIIALSGTPCTESWSSIYHQFWISNYSPFPQVNFYKWVKEYVNVTQLKLSHATVNDYSGAILDKIMPVVDPYFVRFTQGDAGFISVINEHIVKLEMPTQLKRLIDRLIDDLVIEGRAGSIVADTPAKLQQKVHQLCSGTILLDEVPNEPRIALTLEDYKARYILERWGDRKIAIFYNFKQEEVMLRQVMGDRITNDLDEFNATDKSFCGQIVSSREGINLSKAECIVFLNLQFSALSYIQSIDRMTTIDRKSSDIYWLFGDGGIEEKIYKVVINKLDYNLAMFRRDYWNARKSNSGKTYQKV